MGPNMLSWTAVGYTDTFYIVIVYVVCIIDTSRVVMLYCYHLSTHLIELRECRKQGGSTILRVLTAPVTPHPLNGSVIWDQVVGHDMLGSL